MSNFWTRTAQAAGAVGAEREAGIRCGLSRVTLRRIHPGESATRTMTTHPDHGQDVPMALTVGHLADSDSLLATRDPELTARFINDALPHLSQLNARARRLTCNGVDAEDLLQETMLKAYAGFNTFSDGTNLRTWLFRIMTNTYSDYLLRAEHRPSEYLIERTSTTVRRPRSRRGADAGSSFWRWVRPSSLFSAEPELADLRPSP